MKTVIYILFFSVLLSFTVSSDSYNCLTEAKIHYYDVTRCDCCGGWVVYIDGKRYLSETEIPDWEHPPSLAFTNKILISGDTVETPIKVRIDYSPSKQCGKIDIHCIEIIN